MVDEMKDTAINASIGTALAAGRGTMAGCDCGAAAAAGLNMGAAGAGAAGRVEVGAAL